VKTLPGPWHGAMEATMFSHWIYQHLKPHAVKRLGMKPCHINDG
jgi:hypothetical protein